MLFLCLFFLSVNIPVREYQPARTVILIPASKILDMLQTVH